jgi:hypothetical protein
MIIRNILEPFPYLLIDNFLDASSFDDVFKEIIYLSPKFVGPDKTFASKHVDNGTYKKKGSGVFIDELYNDRSLSSILTNFNSVFSPDVIQASKENGWFFKHYYHVTNRDWTLVQSYGDGDYYKSHNDDCLFTAILLIRKEPKEYGGGELLFPEYNHFLDLNNNQAIIFPSRIPHEVLPISRTSDNIDGNRFTISKFIHYKSIDNG